MNISKNFHLCVESCLSQFGGDTEVGRGTYCIQMWIGVGGTAYTPGLNPLPPPPPHPPHLDVDYGWSLCSLH